MLIAPPFANYHRAELERLVRISYEGLEFRAAEIARHGGWGPPSAVPMNPTEFQILMAAEYYLRTTAKTPATPADTPAPSPRPGSPSSSGQP